MEPRTQPASCFFIIFLSCQYANNVVILNNLFITSNRKLLRAKFRLLTFVTLSWKGKASLLVVTVGDFFEDSVEFLNRLPWHKVEDVTVLIVSETADLLLVDTADTNGGDLEIDFANNFPQNRLGP